MSQINDPEFEKRIINELNSCLEYINADSITTSQIDSYDREKQTITITFKYNVVEEDDYVGLCFY